MRSRREKRPWAFDVLERKLEPLLDLHAPLEQARSDLGGVHLEMRRPGDCHREERGISGPLGLFERRMAVGDRLGDLGPDQAIEGSIGQNPRRPPVVGLRFGQRIVQERDRRRLWARCVRASSRRTSARSTPAESPGGAPRASPRSALSPRRGGRSPRAECRRRRARRRVVRRQLGGQLAELCRGGGRAACCGLLGGGVELGRGDGVGPLDRRAPCAAPSPRDRRPSWRAPGGRRAASSGFACS